eukprot:scaffold75710_cov72-Attheya_sp.AAC.1
MDVRRGSRDLSSCLCFLYLTNRAKDTTKRVEQCWLQGQANKGTNETDGKKCFVKPCWVSLSDYYSYSYGQ